MTRSNGLIISTVTFAASLLCGCGTYVPDIQEPFQTPFDAQELVDAIISQVECEVQDSVQYVILRDMDNAVFIVDGKAQGRKLQWLDTWAAQIVLNLTIEEKTNLNPGLSFNTPMHNGITNFVGEVLPGAYPASLTPFVAANTFSALASSQSYVLGFGGSFSADAQRKESLSLFMEFKKFTDKASLTKAKLKLENSSDLTTECHKGNGRFFIQSDLKLREWLVDTLFHAYVQPDYAEDLKSSKKDAISHEVNFVIIYGGNVTPSWKLVRVSADQSSPLFGATRTNTQDLQITLGPPTATPGQLSQAAQNTALASQIGQSVAAAIKSSQ